VSDVIREVVFGPFWLMLPGLGPNRSTSYVNPNGLTEPKTKSLS